MRLYLVDDDPLMRRMVMRMLASDPVECIEFASAAAFLDRLDTSPFGCVLLDIQMPDHHGLNVLDAVLSRTTFPVIMASGSTDIDDAIMSFRRGAVHFLRKPFDYQTLKTTLAEAERVGLAREAERERRAQASRVRLTAREQQVLEAAAAGHQSKNIAWKLGLSVRTVEMHRSNVLAKLHAANATQAVAIARSLRLLPDLGTAA